MTRPSFLKWFSFRHIWLQCIKCNSQNRFTNYSWRTHRSRAKKYQLGYRQNILGPSLLLVKQTVLERFSDSNYNMQIWKVTKHRAKESICKKKKRIHLPYSLSPIIPSPHLLIPALLVFSNTAGILCAIFKRGMSLLLTWPYLQWLHLTGLKTLRDG